MADGLNNPEAHMMMLFWALWTSDALVNCLCISSVSSDDDLNSVLRGIIDQASIKTEVAVKVVIARDTRSAILFTWP